MLGPSGIISPPMMQLPPRIFVSSTTGDKPPTPNGRNLFATFIPWLTKLWPFY